MSSRCHVGLERNSHGCAGCFICFHVETLVDHTGNLAVAAEGQPTGTVLRVAVLGFKFEQRTVPLADTHVEEDVELIYAHAKEFGKEEVTALVQQYEQRDGQDEL